MKIRKRGVSRFTFAGRRLCYVADVPIRRGREHATGEGLPEKSRSDSMFDLILEGHKVIMMFVLIGTIIGLSHFGKQPASARRTNRR
jgi:hypothetical protein